MAHTPAPLPMPISAQRYGPVQDGAERGALISEIHELRTSLTNTRGEAHQALMDQHNTLAFEAQQALENQAAGYTQARDMLAHETVAWTARYSNAVTTAEGNLANLQGQEQIASTAVHNLRSELEQSQGHTSQLMHAATSSTDIIRAAEAGEQQLEAELHEQRLQLNVAEHKSAAQTKEIVQAEEQVAHLQGMKGELDRRGQHIEQTRVYADGQTSRYNEDMRTHKQEIQGLQLKLGDSSHVAEVLQQKISQMETSIRATGDEKNTLLASL